MFTTVIDSDYGDLTSREVAEADMIVVVLENEEVHVTKSVNPAIPVTLPDPFRAPVTQIVLFSKLEPL